VDCEAQICPDLVGAIVIEHVSHLYQNSCYRIVKGLQDGVDGCMELNITTGICNVYLPPRASTEVRNHEYSHCNGWAHSWNHRTQRYEWYPMPEVEMYSLGDRRPTSKDAGT
jgi:hypothetical protein